MGVARDCPSCPSWRLRPCPDYLEESGALAHGFRFWIGASNSAMVRQFP
ncbi:hypothetical protein FOQG_19579 [Fusarium oxysporum f. sp. raphani 54005]|uniref:Uncharacterized protein n=1 Tax=Fusarium oxysporum f. sp. raphani 54005 TaxID=1089458 RepID=X0B0N9_FUSOX|nr:hypothetical protein FOQG_19579 [Fusarium oxysporum f. sp. raphani 54005]